MYEKIATVKSPLGLHARPASFLTKECLKFKSKIKIHTAEKIIDPRSILSIMGAAIKQGTSLRVVGEGPDEVEAVEAIATFIDNIVD